MLHPVFNDKYIKSNRVLQGEPMTVNGAIQITAFLALLVFAGAAFTWSRFTLGFLDLTNILMIGGGSVAFVTGIIVLLARVKFLIPVYAIAEGCFLGGISASFEAIYPGIVVNAVAGSFAALFSMLILYKLNIIRCTDKFRSVIFISTLSIFGIYFVNFIGYFFHFAVPIINTASTLGILFSLFVVVIAALNLILDFDFIEQGERNYLPQDMEWFGAFGLMITLIWLYIEMLKLLAKLQSRE